MHFYFFPECTAVKITLSNDALATHGSYAGTYEKSTDVNGKPSYTSCKNYVIWYLDIHNLWMIGPISDIGSVGFMGAFDNFGGLTDEKNIWIYNDQTKVNDIIVECVIQSQGRLCLFNLTLKHEQ